MKRTAFIIIFFSLSCDLFSQVKRNADGSRNLLSGPDSLLASRLCKNYWVWIEGIEDKSKLGSFVFSLDYKPDGTVIYNQRAKPGYWKVIGNYVYHVVDSSLIDKQPHHFGIFEGTLKVEKITDSVLVLKRVSKKTKYKPEFFKLVPKIEKQQLANEVYLEKITHYYKKVISPTGSNQYYKDDAEISQAAFEAETKPFDIPPGKPVRIIEIDTFGTHSYQYVHYTDGTLDYFRDGVKQGSYPIKTD